MTDLTLTYDGSEKANKALCDMATLSLPPGGGMVTLEIVITAERSRTLKQNRSLHKGLDLLCKVLNDAGLEQRKVIENMKEGFDLPWTVVSAKEWLYRPYQKALTGKSSTTELITVEPSFVFDVMCRNLAAELGITPPAWPSIDNQRMESIGK
jgi:hypothetical protein